MHLTLEARSSPDAPRWLDLRLRGTRGLLGEGRLRLDLRRPLHPRDPMAPTWSRFLQSYRAGAAEPVDADAAGADLHRMLVLESGLGPAWAAARGAAGGAPLSLTLRLGPHAHALASLPIELLQEADEPLFAHPGSSLVRAIDGLTPRAPQLTPGGRVLMAWASPPDLTTFDPEPHVDALRACFGDRLRVLAQARPEQLHDALTAAAAEGRPFELLHLLMHGYEGAQGGAGVWMLDEAGYARRHPALELAEGARRGGVQLAVLCSCQSATSTSEGPLSGTAHQLLRVGDVPGVVATQANLPAARSAVLARRLYLHLEETRDPAAALSRARREAWQHGPEWSVPVYLGRPPDAHGAADAPAATLEVGLPPRPRSSQARPTALAEAWEALATSTLMSLTGLCGSGKSWLAQELAREALSKRLVRRVLYVEATPGMTVEGLRVRLSAALGLAHVGAVAELAAELHSVEDAPLLVVDGAEALTPNAPARAALEAALRTLREGAPTLRVLLTSRLPLGGERTIRVGPMSWEQVQALLLAELSLHDRPAPHNTPALASVLGGLPLSATLAARLLCDEAQPPSGLLARLRQLIDHPINPPQDLRDWGAPGALDEVSRGALEALLAVLRLELERLEQDAPAAYRDLLRLGCFPAGVPESVAHALCGGDRSLTLGRLLEAGLLEWSDERVRLPTPLQWLAGQRLPGSGVARDATLARGLEAMAEFTYANARRDAGRHTPRGVARVAPELATLAQLVDFARAHPPRPGERSPLVKLARSAAQVLMVLGARELERRLLELALEHARVLESRHDQAHLLLCIGDHHFEEDRAGEALVHLHQALAIYDSLGKVAAMAECYFRIGLVLTDLEQLDEARTQLEQAAALHAEASNPSGAGYALLSLGDALSFQDKLGEAIEAYGRALSLLREAHSRTGVAVAQLAMGKLHARRSELDPAERYLRGAVEGFEDLDRPDGLASALHHLGSTLLRRHRWREALPLLERSLEIFERRQDDEGCARTLTSLGRLQRRHLDPNAARAHLERALPLARGAANPRVIVHALLELGELHAALQELEQARERTLEVLEISRAHGMRLPEANALTTLGQVQLRRHALEDARRSLTSAQPLYEAIEERVGLANTHALLGLVCDQELDRAAAGRHYARALELYRATKEKDGEARCLSHLADHRSLHGDLPEARRALERALALSREIDSPARIIETLCALARQDLHLNTMEDAERRLQEAQRLAEDLGLPELLATTHTHWGDLLLQRGRLDDARGHLTAAVQRAQEAGYPCAEARALNALGELHLMRLQLPEAQQALERARSLWREHEEELGLSQALRSLGELYTRRYKLAKAARCLTEAAHRAHRARWTLGEANALHGLGELQTRTSNFDQAERSLTEALALYRRQRSLHGEARALQSLGSCAHWQGQLAEATEHFEAAMAAFEALEQPLGVANALASLVDVRRGQGATGEELIPMIERALGLFEGQGNPLGEANLLDSLAAIHLAEGRPAEGFACALRTLPLYEQTEERLGKASALQRLAWAITDCGHPAQGIALLERSLSICQEVGNKLSIYVCMNTQQAAFFVGEDLPAATGALLLCRQFAESLMPSYLPAVHQTLERYFGGLAPEVRAKVEADPEAARLEGVRRALALHEASGRDLFAPPE